MRLVKDRFVPLAVDGRVVNFCEDAETEFLSKPTICVANSASGGAWVVAAGGKRLARAELHPGKDVYRTSLERGLTAFAALPPGDREPGAVKVPDRGPIDPKRAAAQAPPAGALVVRVFNRQLGRTAAGELRHTVPEDYIAPLRDPDVVGSGDATALFRQPANDFLWVTRAECRAMMPADPREGQDVDVPRTLCERLFRFHLDPGRGLTESDAFAHATAAAGRLRMTVDRATKQEVRLRLDGSADLHNPRRYLLDYQSPGVKKHSRSQIPLDYRPRLLGYLSYDPTKSVVTRFDVVALGDVCGRPVDSNLFGERVGDPNLLGVAFELVADPKPADLVPPKGLRAGRGYDLNRYLGTK